MAASFPAVRIGFIRGCFLPPSPSSSLLFEAHRTISFLLSRLLYPPLLSGYLVLAPELGIAAGRRELFARQGASSGRPTGGVKIFAKVGAEKFEKTSVRGNWDRLPRFPFT